MRRQRLEGRRVTTVTPVAPHTAPGVRGQVPVAEVNLPFARAGGKRRRRVREVTIGAATLLRRRRGARNDRGAEGPESQNDRAMGLQVMPHRRLRLCLDEQHFDDLHGRLIVNGQRRLQSIDEPLLALGNGAVGKHQLDRQREDRWT